MTKKSLFLRTVSRDFEMIDASALLRKEEDFSFYFLSFLNFPGNQTYPKFRIFLNIWNGKEENASYHFLPQ